jgi:hypothetical protein
LLVFVLLILLFTDFFHSYNYSCDHFDLRTLIILQVLFSDINAYEVSSIPFGETCISRVNSVSLLPKFFPVCMKIKSPSNVWKTACWVCQINMSEELTIKLYIKPHTRGPIWAHASYEAFFPGLLNFITRLLWLGGWKCLLSCNLHNTN